MQFRYPIVLFDGVCNFCNRTVNFLIRQDRRGRLRFATLQGTTGQQLLRQHGLPADNLLSFVLVENGRAFQKSTAALKLLRHLPWYWQWARLGWLLPPFLRNGMYDVIARNRYHWFGRQERCMVPSPNVRARFL